MCASAEAPEPPPPVIEIVGTEVYPVPALVIVKPVIDPPLTEAVAVAPVPPPPVMVTEGAVEYPVPPFLTPIKLILPLVLFHRQLLSQDKSKPTKANLSVLF